MHRSTRPATGLVAGSLILAALACGNQSAFAQRIRAQENRSAKANANLDANAQAPADGDAAANADSGLEVLTSGPIHEAFAPVITMSPQPGVVAVKAPPEMIDETPPSQRPAGANVAWIPGYWAWDGDRDDYLWITGLWRTIPPNPQPPTMPR